MSAEQLARVALVRGVIVTAVRMAAVAVAAVVMTVMRVVMSGRIAAAGRPVPGARRVQVLQRVGVRADRPAGQQHRQQQDERRARLHATSSRPGPRSTGT